MSVPCATSSSTLSIQCDWEYSVRQCTTALQHTYREGAWKELDKESKQFWISSRVDGDDDKECEDVIELQPPFQLNGEDGAAAPPTSTSSTAHSPPSPTHTTTLLNTLRSITPLSTHQLIQVKLISPLTLVASCSQTGAEQVVRAPRLTFSPHRKGNVLSIDVAPDNKWALSGGEDGDVSLWLTSNIHHRRSVEGTYGDVHVVKFFPSSSVFLTAGLDPALRIYTIEGALVTTLKNNNSISRVQLIDRGRQLITIDRQSPKLWDVSTQQTIATYNSSTTQGGIVRDGVLLCKEEGGGGSADGDSRLPLSLSPYLLSTVTRTGLQLYDVRMQSCALSVSLGSGVQCIAAGMQEKTVMYGTETGSVGVVDLRTKSIVSKFRTDDAGITNLSSWSSNSFLSTSSTGGVYLWDADQSRISNMWSGADCEPVYSVAYGSEYLYTTAHNAIRIYNLDNGDKQVEGIVTPGRESAEQRLNRLRSKQAAMEVA